MSKHYAVAVTDTLADEYNVPLPGAAEYVALLREGGNRVTIHDPRANGPLGLRMLAVWLLQAGIDYDTIWDGWGKPEADVYIDGRSERPDF